ncbi:MAG: amidohydrolase family protein [Pirellulaceae bacterium]|nr:amidohydrolase family protein [Pirellulaceae bacterium]
MNAPYSRRTFLGQAAGLAAAGTLLPAAALRPAGSARADDPATGADDVLPVIDTHQHLWDLDRFRLPWLESQPKLRRNFLTADYLQATRGLNVVRAVYMEVDVDPAQQRAEAEYVIELSRSAEHPTVAAVISGRPASEQFADYIGAYRDSPYIKGVRQVLHAPSARPGLCLDKTFVRHVRLLGELGMRFDLCMRPGELGDAVRLADQCPDTRLVLDHCGNADPKWFTGGESSAETTRSREQWRRQIGELAERKHVVCKISGIVVRAEPGRWKADDLAPVVNHCLDQFGPDRVMFGGDWPVCTLAASFAEWIGALRQIVAERPRDQQRKLFHDNAQRFYELA